MSGLKRAAADERSGKRAKNVDKGFEQTSSLVRRLREDQQSPKASHGVDEQLTQVVETTHADKLDEQPMNTDSTNALAIVTTKKSPTTKSNAVVVHKQLQQQPKDAQVKHHIAELQANDSLRFSPAETASMDTKVFLKQLLRIGARAYINSLCDMFPFSNFAFLRLLIEPIKRALSQHDHEVQFDPFDTMGKSNPVFFKGTFDHLIERLVDVGREESIEKGKNKSVRIKYLKIDGRDIPVDSTYMQMLFSTRPKNLGPQYPTCGQFGNVPTIERRVDERYAEADKQRGQPSTSGINDEESDAESIIVQLKTGMSVPLNEPLDFPSLLIPFINQFSKDECEVLRNELMSLGQYLQYATQLHHFMFPQSFLSVSLLGANAKQRTYCTVSAPTVTVTIARLGSAAYMKALQKRLDGCEKNVELLHICEDMDRKFMESSQFKADVLQKVATRLKCRITDLAVICSMILSYKSASYTSMLHFASVFQSRLGSRNQLSSLTSTETSNQNKLFLSNNAPIGAILSIACLKTQPMYSLFTSRQGMKDKSQLSSTKFIVLIASDATFHTADIHEISQSVHTDSATTACNLFTQDLMLDVLEYLPTTEEQAELAECQAALASCQGDDFDDQIE
jgi:hypothetical protein